MPTSERRYYLGLLLRNKHNQEEQQVDKAKITSTGKGIRKTTTGGAALKNKIRTGDLPK